MLIGAGWMVHGEHLYVAVRHAAPDRRSDDVPEPPYAASSDIAHYFPGRRMSESGDVKPSPEEIERSRDLLRGQVRRPVGVVGGGRAGHANRRLFGRRFD